MCFLLFDSFSREKLIRFAMVHYISFVFIFVFVVDLKTLNESLNKVIYDTFLPFYQLSCRNWSSDLHVGLDFHHPLNFC